MTRRKRLFFRVYKGRALGRVYPHSLLCYTAHRNGKMWRVCRWCGGPEDPDTWFRDHWNRHVFIVAQQQRTDYGDQKYLAFDNLRWDFYPE